MFIQSLFVDQYEHPALALALAFALAEMETEPLQPEPDALELEPELALELDVHRGRQVLLVEIVSRPTPPLLPSQICLRVVVTVPTWPAGHEEHVTSSDGVQSWITVH